MFLKNKLVPIGLILIALIVASLNQYYTQGYYSINALQCRARGCVVEINIGSFEHVNRFIDWIQRNRGQCHCAIADYALWMEENRAVIKFLLYEL